MIKIIKLSNLENDSVKEDFQSLVMDIFFLSTSIKEFSSPEKKASFFKRWCGDYIELYPDFFYLMVEENKLLGYLSGCLDSHASLSVLEVPGLPLFADLFSDYPAHLHINFHPDCRGRGLGSVLVNEYCTDLAKLKITGVHLVTSPGAANISFYSRLGFDHQVERNLNQMNLLFMGRKLTAVL